MHTLYSGFSETVSINQRTCCCLLRSCNSDGHSERSICKGLCFKAELHLLLTVVAPGIQSG